MGCCCSSQARAQDEDAVVARQALDTSPQLAQQPETQQQAQPLTIATNVATDDAAQRAMFRRISPPPGATPPNQPLASPPASHFIEPPLVAPNTAAGEGGDMAPARTAAAVRAARAEFFDTRTNGRPEMWAAVRLVCELVERGDLQDAQAVLDAAGGTCPSGMLWGRKGGCYDEKGERYVVPTWCVGWPDEVELDGEDTYDGTEELPKSRRMSNKGKGRATSDEGSSKGREIKVRARLSHNARDIVIKLGEEDPVSVLISRVKTTAKIPTTTKVHVGYLGRMLSEKESLASQGWREGHVVNLFVFE